MERKYGVSVVSVLFHCVSGSYLPALPVSLQCVVQRTSVGEV